MAKRKKNAAVRKWTTDEIALLKKLYPENSIPELAKMLGRAVPTIKHKAYELEIKRKSWHEKLWTSEEIKLLRELYPTCEDIQDIAERIGRSPNAVRVKAYDLGLSKLRKPHDRL